MATGERVPLGGVLTEHVGLGVLISSVPRDAVDEAVREAGVRARRKGGSLPPHVVFYFVMGLALFADEDYEEVLEQLTCTLASWDCWDEGWELPTVSAAVQARQRLGKEMPRLVFEQVCVPVADLEVRGAFLSAYRLASVDGMEWDCQDTDANAAFFGKPSGCAFPKARVVTLVESGSRAPFGAHIGPGVGKETGERAALEAMLGRLEEDMLLMADRGFYSFDLWAKASQRCELLWRLSDSTETALVEQLPDGSWSCLLFHPDVRKPERRRLVEAAKAGRDVAPQRARLVRTVEYEVPDRGEGGQKGLICLATTVLEWMRLPAVELAQAYHDRWSHETANGEEKTELRGPGRILRSKSPDMVVQELYGYLITHHAVRSLICRAAVEADIDPDRISFTKTVRIIRRSVTDAASFSP